MESTENIKFVCLSDTHANHNKINVPDGDVLLYTGDFSNKGRPKEIENFAKFLQKLPHTYKVVIAGNHDLTMEPDKFESEHKKRFFTSDF